ncbi:MAG: hypothetical protein A3F78_01250 [Burkholderiales bacterium RIFCSPLOWO2_12_FULL_61_40]|nr:MAG: hypothetical protein A3F78_01250 [Burkholderiales bacterium RIFCSPLOWO2_12_FULL_61_40]
MITQYYGGLNFLNVPWLAGMVILFLAEFIEGNTVTRLYFMRLRRLTGQALQLGQFTPELEQERGKLVPSFTHFLDLPALTALLTLHVGAVFYHHFFLRDGIFRRMWWRN